MQRADLQSVEYNRQQVSKTLKGVYSGPTDFRADSSRSRLVEHISLVLIHAIHKGWISELGALPVSKSDGFVEEVRVQVKCISSAYLRIPFDDLHYLSLIHI